MGPVKTRSTPFRETAKPDVEGETPQAAMHPQDQSLFFTKLPTELRLEIYRHALTTPHPIITPLYPSDRPECTPHLTHSLPALGAGLNATCKRVNDEIDMSLLYKTNTFVLTHPSAANAWSVRLHPQHRGAITNLTIDFRHAIDTESGMRDHEAEQNWLSYLTCPTSIRAPPSQQPHLRALAVLSPFARLPECAACHARRHGYHGRFGGFERCQWTAVDSAKGDLRGG